MFQLNSAAIMLRLEHRHSDGSWSQLEAPANFHDPSQLDPERSWATGRIYACPKCAEQVRVTDISNEPGLTKP
jgi:hypothetical protein